jgi:hypothetical protein
LWGCIVSQSKDSKTSSQEVNERDETLMQRVCRKWSPLCNDWYMYQNAMNIFKERWVPWEIALWIMNAESTIGKHYARWCDASYNNWGGIKWRKNDDWSNTKDQKIPDSNWCWMYKFESMKDYFISKANTLGIWYKTCFTHNKETYSQVKCISFAYVWNPRVAETNWIKNVMEIAE